MKIEKEEEGVEILRFMTSLHQYGVYYNEFR
jgi:hypothetical protein